MSKHIILTAIVAIASISIIVAVVMAGNSFKKHIAKHQVARLPRSLRSCITAALSGTLQYYHLFPISPRCMLPSQTGSKDQRPSQCRQI